MGYYSTGSTAIKASHALYKECAGQMELNKDFYIKGKKLFWQGHNRSLPKLQNLNIPLV